MWTKWLRLFGREILVIVLLALPVLSLLPLGFLWLVQAHGTIIWAAVMFACVLSASLLMWMHQGSESSLSAPTEDPGEAVWGDREKAVWEQVKQHVDATPPPSLNSQDQILAVMRSTVELVAAALHPDARTPIGRFTVPEALLALEQLSRALRADLLKRLPMSHKVRISDVIWLAEQRHNLLLLQRVWTMFRLARVVAGPTAAIASEARSWLWNLLKNQSAERAQTLLVRVMALEVGRAAINLYGGRFRLNAAEIQQLVADETVRLFPAPPPAPIRILLAGQVNAGKSSLVNALAGETRAPVNPLPTQGGFQVFELQREGQPAVIIVDSPGLNADARGLDLLREQALNCDLLLWVAAANQPARALDARALEQVRSALASRLDRLPPPILLLVTHIDQLRPAREWAPPYDIANPSAAKARSIRDALETTALALQFAATDAIPVAMPQAATAYNVDIVWARITELLPQAQQTQLNRLITNGRGAWNVEQILGQAYSGGRALFSEVLRTKAGRGRWSTSAS